MRGLILLTTLCSCGALPAQNGNGAPATEGPAGAIPADTRAGQIEQARQQKAASLSPDNPPKAERIFTKASKALTNIFGVPGLSIKLGGMATGSGFALGPEYQRAFMDEHALMITSAEVSTHLWEMGALGVHFGRLPTDRFFANFDSGYRNFTSVNYYGDGPDSQKTGRTDYHLTDETLDGVFGVRPVAPLDFGFQAGLVDVDVGSGEEHEWASTTVVYPPALAPGIGAHPWYLRAGPVAAFDYRDDPNQPHSGGYYHASYLYYDDERYGAYTFRRLTGEAQQYVPLFYKTHVLAFRFRTEMSYANGSDIVPFYMQPVLGGDDLRGFRPFRFYGNDMEVANAEYRWTVFSGLELAAFYDTGKVFQTASDFGVRGLEKSIGFGVRFLSPTGTAMRIDTGFSNEGFEILVKFTPVWSDTDNKVRGW